MSYVGKKILIIGAGELQIPLIKAAKNLGVFVITSDKNPKAIGFKYADAFIIADTMSPQDSLEKIQEYIKLNGEIHGVATAGTDASLTVATIANYYKLPGHQVDAALNASDKALMRKAFETKHISIPRYKKITHLKEALEFFNHINKACVLKPTRNMGARGISLVKTEEELAEAFHLALENNRGIVELLIEEFIDAHELSIDALIDKGEITITGIGDRIIEYPPYFVETGHILPSSLPQDWLDRAILTFKDGIKALGLSHGAAKADIKISETNTWIVEIAARLSGGFMSSHTFPYATGIPLHKHMIEVALGEPLSELISTHNLVSVERAIILPPGTIKHIDIPVDILEQEYISHFSFRAKVGDIIHTPKNNLDKAGNIIATAPTRELAFRAIHKALQSLIIDIEDSRDLDFILKNSNENAKKKLKTVCNVCRYCDGIWCKGLIPGVGGVGTGEGFIQAYNRYRDIKLIPHYIHNITEVDTSIQMFGQQLSMPVFVAPIGGAKINYNNALSELEFQRALIKGAYQSGTLAFTADPGYPDDFPASIQATLENFGHTIPICKPRKNSEHMKERFKSYKQAGAIALGSDIDGIGLKTLSLIGQDTCPKDEELWKELINTYSLPFVLKGVLSVSDALKAVEAGATHIIVSSHGGRIGESFPLPIDMLPNIKKAVGDKVTILLDGSIRSGSDVIKALILGADAVLIGRPIAIHAIGGGYEAVTAYLKQIQEQIKNQMIFLGQKNIAELKNHPELIIN